MTLPTTPDELGHSPDALAQRQAELLALLRQAAPDTVADNQVNFDRLKALLGGGQDGHIAPPEHYELSWAGKAAARREIQKTSSHTLRPSAGNPAHAPHMLIEGENLEVLRVLQKSYYGKVKMIYIDPPYNTGNDSFVYPDDYSETLDEYQKRTGEKNEAGFLNKQSLWKKNSKESGQYHSAWLSMMYPRLYLARNLLRDDGVIFISIDDNEAANLKLLCDEVFGAENFVSQAVWQRSKKGDSKLIANVHEYIVCYVKSRGATLLNGNWRLPKPGADRVLEQYKSLLNTLGNDHGSIRLAIKKWFKELPATDPAKAHKHYDWSDSRGLYFADNFAGPDDGRASRPRHDIFHPENGKPCKKPSTGWRWDADKTEWALAQTPQRIHFGMDETTIPMRKSYLFEIDSEPFSSVFYQDGRSATLEVEDLIGKGCFPFPKNTSVVKDLVRLSSETNDIILDFFAGSGTTAHAVMELNAEDGGNRQCISVQLPEVLAEDSEAYKAGYRTIADITRARIEKVIAKLKAAQQSDLLKAKPQDVACAHFTLAPSNFKTWRGDIAGAEALRAQLALFQSAEKLDSRLRGNDEQVDAQTAMLAELLLKMGLGALGVHAIAKPKQVAGATVHRALLPDDRALWLCFERYSEALKDEIAKEMPAQVVMLNSCFVGDNADEQLANLQLELAGLEIGLTVI